MSGRAPTTRKSRRARVLSLDLSDRQPIHELVYDGLRRAILDGQIHAETRLIEAKLAEELRVSRTPVREALHKLEVEGLVRSAPPRGVIVRRVSRLELLELLQIRRLIEPHASALAIGSLGREDLRALDRAASEASSYASAKPGSTTANLAHVRFYDLLAERCPNRQLGALVRDLRKLFVFLDRTVSASSLLTADQRKAATGLLPRILAACVRHDAATVERLVADRLDLLTAAVETMPAFVERGPGERSTAERPSERRPATPRGTRSATGVG